ncbi:MAG: DUF348 domain-containing protein [Chloroflexi bacterium]|nr:DUF348 domain-containing protein [Chloroflexota bacterium]
MGSGVTGLQVGERRPVVEASLQVGKSAGWRAVGGGRRLVSRAVGCLLLVLFLPAICVAACAQPLPVAETRAPLQIQIKADGQTTELATTSATTVREALAEAGIIVNDADEVTPPLFTPLGDDAALTVAIVRITESIEVIPRALPFDRQLVRNEAMDANDPPRIIQAGRDGLEEETIRIVYRDGLEAERWVTQVAVIEPAQAEIVMVGVGAAQGNVSFDGALAYISGGNPVLLRGLSAFPEPLNSGGGLDGRVFSLSPDASHLLYTRIMTETASFSASLWVVSTERGAKPWPLGVENVLWADWDPSAKTPLQIAYTTAVPTNLPPGWEANNDLWLGAVPSNPEASFQPEQLIEAYPATYGWWGGNYAWSPGGRLIAYSYANEVGVIDTETVNPALQRRQLQQFTEYNTRSDWVWVPTLTWSADGRFLAFTNHDSADTEELAFSSWAADAETGVAARFVPGSGMWAHLHWNPAGDEIAYLRATDPLNNQTGSYALWLMDGDGSNGRRLYPPQGELSHFPREQHFMAWGPNGRMMAFVFENALYILDLETGQANRVTQEDAVVSHPTWVGGTAVAPAAPDQSDDFPLPRIP